jgi:hypothetical protein
MHGQGQGDDESKEKADTGNEFNQLAAQCRLPVCIVHPVA